MVSSSWSLHIQIGHCTQTFLLPTQTKQECIPVECVPPARLPYSVVSDWSGVCPLPPPPPEAYPLPFRRYWSIIYAYSKWIQLSNNLGIKIGNDNSRSILICYKCTFLDSCVCILNWIRWLSVQLCAWKISAQNKYGTYCLLTSLINKSADWPPNYHKTARTFLQICAPSFNEKAESNRASKNIDAWNIKRGCYDICSFFQIGKTWDLPKTIKKVFLQGIYLQHSENLEVLKIKGYQNCSKYYAGDNLIIKWAYCNRLRYICCCRGLLLSISLWAVVVE